MASRLPKVRTRVMSVLMPSSRRNNAMAGWQSTPSRWRVNLAPVLMDDAFVSFWFFSWLFLSKRSPEKKRRCGHGHQGEPHQKEQVIANRAEAGVFQHKLFEAVYRVSKRINRRDHLHPGGE